MKFSELFGAGEQDHQIETMQRMLKFRDVLFDYAKQSGSEEAKELAPLVMFALFGATYKYKACCILFFVENAFHDRPNPRTYCPVDQRVLCQKCQNELAEWILDTKL